MHTIDRSALALGKYPRITVWLTGEDIRNVSQAEYGRLTPEMRNEVAYENLCSAVRSPDNAPREFVDK